MSAKKKQASANKAKPNDIESVPAAAVGEAGNEKKEERTEETAKKGADHHDQPPPSSSNSSDVIALLTAKFDKQDAINSKLVEHLLKQEKEKEAAAIESKNSKEKRKASKKKESEKRKKHKKNKKSDSNSSSDDNDESQSDSSDSDDTSDSSSGNSSDEEMSLISRKKIMRMYDNKLDLLGARGQAEVRCNYWIMKGAVRIHAKEMEKDKDLKPSKAFAFVMKALEARSKAVIDFETSTEETPIRLKKILKTVSAAAKPFPLAKKIRRDAEDMLPISEGSSRASAFNAKGRKRPYESNDTRIKKEVEAQLAARTEVKSEPVMNEAAVAKMISSGIQQQAAASMPYRNNGYNPVKRICFNCQSPDHILSMCPHPRGGLPYPAIAAKPYVKEVRDTDHNNNQNMMSAVEMRSYCPSKTPPHRWSVVASPHRWRGEANTLQISKSGAVKESDEKLMNGCDVDAVLSVRNLPNSGFKLPALENVVVCKCGYCGACTHNIDLMQKEQKEQLGPARLEAARRVELNQRRLDDAFEIESNAQVAADTNHMNLSYSVDASLEVEMLKRESDAASIANASRSVWESDVTIEDEEESEEEKVRETPVGGPMNSPATLRDVLKGNEYGRKVFDRYDALRVCIFCKRRGHRRRECMVAPETRELRFVEEDGSETTKLQLQKQRFVLGLMSRGRAPEVTSLMRKEDGNDRMPAVRRVMQLGEKANEGNPWQGSEKRRDMLRKSLGFWWAIGADQTVLSWIGFGVRLKFEVEPQKIAFSNHKSYHVEKEHIQKEHDTHVKDGSFRVGRPEEAHVGNPLQVEVNEKGKRRSCVDMRYTNSFIADYEFTQETLNKHVAQIVKKGMMMITTDVAKAYYQVPLHKSSQKYCAWRHNGEWIIPTILVFGLSIAPFIFTKIMRVVLTFMRAMRIHGTNCIDDNLWAEFENMMGEVVEIVKLVFGKLGWVFNEKCVLTPSRQVIYNGMWVDSTKFEIRATSEKIDAARRLAWKMWYTARDGGEILLNDLQKIAGRLQSMKLALEGVAVFTRGMYADIAKALKDSDQRPGKYFRMQVRERALADLNFWAFRLGKQNGLPINDEGTEVHLTMNTDASDVGYGAHTNVAGSEIHGELPIEVLGSSSTAREIMGVILAAGRMVNELRGRRVRVCMDSLPAICNFINGGGPVEELNELVQQWWIWCRRNRVTPLYKWMRREENSRADELSKEAAASYRIQIEVEAKIRVWLQEECNLPGMNRHEYTRTRVIAPRLDTINVRIQEMKRARVPACIVVPAWKSAPWRTDLMTKEILYLGRMKEVLEGEVVEQGGQLAYARWGMEAHVVRG